MPAPNRNPRGAVNWAKHPNILKLPGFQFDLNENGGIVSHRDRGMLAMLFHKNFRKPSREGMIGVAGRLQRLFQACLAVVRSGDDVPLLSEPFWNKVFVKLLAENPDQLSLNMDKNYGALTANLRAFENGRRRFIDSGAVLTDAEMEPVLATVDEWLKLGENEADPLADLGQQLIRLPGARRIVREHTAQRAQKVEEAAQDVLDSKRKYDDEGSPPPPFFFDVKRRKNDHDHVEDWDWLLDRVASMKRKIANLETDNDRQRGQLAQAASRNDRIGAEKQAMVQRIRKETNEKEVTKRYLDEALGECDALKLVLAEAERTAARAVERLAIAERENAALVREQEALIEDKEALAKDIEMGKSVAAAEARKASVFDDRYRAAQQLYRNRVKNFESKLEPMEALVKENKAMTEERDGLLRDVDMAKALTAAEAQKASVFDDRYKAAQQLYGKRVKMYKSQIEEMNKEIETLNEHNV